MNEQIILNPISDIIRKSVSVTKNKLIIAVPFLNSFAKSIVNKNNSINIKDKRLITKFDDSNLTTFDLPTLEHFLDCGFKICYNNNIHLKLYITDKNTFVTSSNLTNGGFENNIELTVKVDASNFEICEQIFENLWIESESSLITRELIDQNSDKYEVLKKRQKFERPKVSTVQDYVNLGQLDIQKLIDKIFNHKEDYTWITNKIYEANKLRNELINKIKTDKFHRTLYFAPEGHSKRHSNLFHNLSYGVESNLASTGMREAQFESLFTHKDFKKVIDFLIPESIGLEPWNLSDENQLYNFCLGVFDFNIPQYKEALPMRMASYFYPEYFLPVFKLEHLKKVSDVLGINKDPKSNGEKFYEYNLFIKDEMKNIPFDNYIKSRMFYDIYYSVELYKKMKKEKDFELIKESYNRDWMKRYLDRALLFLEEIKAIEN